MLGISSDYNMIISGGVRKVSVNGNNHKLESSKSLQEHFYGSSSNEVVKSDGNGFFITTIQMEIAFN